MQKQVDVNAAMYLDEVKKERSIQLERIRQDIREQRKMLADEIVLDAAGNFIRRKEFLTVLPQKYSVCNFYLSGQPFLYQKADNPGERILWFNAVKEDGRCREVYINLKMADRNYLRRQFRNAGLKLKVRASQVVDFIPLLLDALVERAVPVILPKKRGFYVAADQVIEYAGRDALLWGEVADHAR